MCKYSELTMLMIHSSFLDDTTRVKIKSSGGDYINANFVNVSELVIGELYLAHKHFH